MIYSEEMKNKIKSNFEQIVKYIEDEILPYIDYDYETYGTSTSTDHLALEVGYEATQIK